MPTDMELKQASRTVYSRAWGALTDADIFGHMRRVADLFQQGRLTSEWAQICDFAFVETMDGVTTQGVRRMAELNPWPRETIRTFIVTTDEQFGLARMYQALGHLDSGDVCITRSSAEADAFIQSERARRG